VTNSLCVCVCVDSNSSRSISELLLQESVHIVVSVPLESL